MLDSHSYRLLPTHPGVYLFKDQNGDVLYVGKAKDLKKRVSSYFLKRDHDAKTLQLVQRIQKIDHIVVYSEVEAFLLEANLIKKYTPFYNINLKDDKFYPYIEIGPAKQDLIPYVTISRKTNSAHAEYFGPYTSAESVKIVLKILRRIFPYQSVRNHQKRTCLYFHLGLCPCIPSHPENLVEYRRNVKKIIHFLNGEKEKVIKQLAQEQKEYVKQEEFEKAGDIQNKIERVKLITSENYDPFAYQEKPDLYFERIRSEVESLRVILLQEDLSVPSLERIECYDISNFSGKQATGSMVVFIKGDAYKPGYRKFKIRGKNTPDDFAMHEELMKRRLKHLEDWGEPNLLVIDGGKGQVSSVLEVLVREGKNYPVIGLAKREETIIVPARDPFGKLELREVKLPKSTPGVNLLRRIRDEAHRFAITYHRLLRKKHALG